MHVWGVTGGVGMGKSTAGELLEQRGFRVLDTDVVARRLTEPGNPALTEIRAAFGARVFRADGSLDRAQLGDLVFRDSAARLELESILHPRIAEAWRQQLDQWRSESAADAAVLIPLLYERGYDAEFATVVAVACTPSTQRRRLIERGWSEEQIEGRNAAQWPVADKMARAKFVIWTEGSLASHGRQWDRILSSTRAELPAAGQ